MCHAGHAGFMWSHEPPLRRLLRHREGCPHLSVQSRTDRTMRCPVPMDPCLRRSRCRVLDLQRRLCCHGRWARPSGRQEGPRRTDAKVDGCWNPPQSLGQEESRRTLRDGRSSWLSGSRSAVSSGPARMYRAHPPDRYLMASRF
jgi:hypothetical protein